MGNTWGDTLYWVWLSLVIGPCSKVYLTLLDEFESVYDIFCADEEVLSQYKNIEDSTVKLLLNKDLGRARRIIDYCAVNNIGILTLGSKLYPYRLKLIKNPPVVLYYRGKLPVFDRKVTLAMVGTRSMTEKGKRSAYKISYELASAGVVVVSGMALGIDSICACATMEAKGITVAVLGCGIDIVYPQEHHTLYEHIMRNGLVITEYPPSTPPNGHHFPQRNRIISGLSQGALIIEASLKSGAMITAREALYQGRDIFALPGNIEDEQSAGPNQLLLKGARLVLAAQDIVSEYEFLYSDEINMQELYNSKYHSDLQSDDVIQKYGVSPVAKDKRQKFESNKKDSNETKIANSEAKHVYKNESSKELEIVNKTVNVPKKQVINTKLTLVESLNEKSVSDSINNDDKQSKSKSYKEQISNIVKSKPTNKDHLAIYEIIADNEDVSADVISNKGIPISKVLVALTMLEIGGFIEAIPGGKYRIK